MLSSYRGNSNAVSPLTSGKPILAEIQGGGVGLGTVIAVALSAPAAEFTVTGSPVTTSGTLTLTKKTQIANLVWAGPAAGVPAQPGFRSLVLADLPALPQQIQLRTDGIVNGSQSLLNLIAGSNINLTDAGNGNVTIDATGGGGGSITLQVEGVPNVNQTLLNFLAGSGNITITDNGNGSVSFAVSPGSLALQVGGTPTESQTLLNFIAGDGIGITDDGSGMVRIRLEPFPVISLQTDGITNGSQTLLNLTAGVGIALIDGGTGQITIQSTFSPDLPNFIANDDTSVDIQGGQSGSLQSTGARLRLITGVTVTGGDFIANAGDGDTTGGNISLRPGTGGTTNGVISAESKFYPPKDDGTPQFDSAQYAGLGAPSNANGADGDYYFRSDGGTGTHIYFKSGGTWAGIV